MKSFLFCSFVTIATPCYYHTFSMHNAHEINARREAVKRRAKQILRQAAINHLNDLMAETRREMEQYRLQHRQNLQSQPGQNK